MTEDCPATLRHLHGEAECYLSEGHEGEHKGFCYCELDSPLSWDELHEDWMK